MTAMADYTRVSTDDTPRATSDHIPATSPTTDPRDVSVVIADDASAKQLEFRKRNYCLHLFPAASASEYKETFKQLVMLSWPVVLYMLATPVITMTSIIFSGHLGKDEIVASSLAQSVIHVFWRSILFGFTTGADTMFAQTYGSENKKRVGIILQRFLVLTTLLAIVCSGILFNTEGILLLFGQDPGIAQLAGLYGAIFIAATPADTVVIILIKYLQNQSIVRPVFVIIGLMGGLNVLLHFVAVSSLRLGLLGAVGGQVVTYYLGAIALFGFIYWRKLYQKTWPGWSWECLQEWGTPLRLALPGALAVCLRWWSFEAGYFITGLLGKTEVGAHSVMFYTTTISWSISSSVGVAAAVLIGNNLGANKPRRAQMMSSCSVVVAVVLGLLYMIFYMSIKDVIGYVFTKEEDVVRLAASVFPVVAIYASFESLGISCIGTLRGCGYQYVTAVGKFISYDVLGIPLGVVLTFVAGQGLQGLWLGFMAALILEAVLLFLFILFFINWDEEAIKAQKRAAVLPKGCAQKSPLHPKEAPSELIHLNGTVKSIPEDEDEVGRCYRDHKTEAGETDDEDFITEKEAEAECAVWESGFCQVSETHDDCSLGDVDEHDGRCAQNGEEPRDDDDNEEDKKRGNVIEVLTLNRLSLTQLVLRRGLALLVCVSLFITSVFISVSVVPTVRPTIQDLVNATANCTTAEYQYVTGDV